MFLYLHQWHTDLLISDLEQLVLSRAVHCHLSTSTQLTECALFFTFLGRRLALTSFPHPPSHFSSILM